jgi:hypothetical protein
MGFGEWVQIANPLFEERNTKADRPVISNLKPLSSKYNGW